MRYVTTIEGVEPVTVAQAKAHLRITWNTEDAYIGSILSAAREYAEKSTSQAIIPQQIRAYYSALPRTPESLDLPLSNAVDVKSVKYIDGSGVQQTLLEAEYTLIVGQPNRLYFLNGVSGTTERMDSVEIIYDAGFGEDPYLPMPSTIQAAILLLTADLYENREAQSSQRFEQNMTADRLLNQNRELGM